MHTHTFSCIGACIHTHKQMLRFISQACMQMQRRWRKTLGLELFVEYLLWEPKSNWSSRAFSCVTSLSHRYFDHVYVSYIRIHAYVYIHTSVYMHAYIYEYICTHLQTYTHIYTCIPTCIRTYTHTYKHTFKYTYTYACVCHNAWMQIERRWRKPFGLELFIEYSLWEPKSNWSSRAFRCFLCYTRTHTPTQTRRTCYVYIHVHIHIYIYSEVSANIHSNLFLIYITILFSFCPSSPHSVPPPFTPHVHSPPPSFSSSPPLPFSSPPRPLSSCVGGWSWGGIMGNKGDAGQADGWEVGPDGAHLGCEPLCCSALLSGSVGHYAVSPSTCASLSVSSSASVSASVSTSDCVCVCVCMCVCVRVCEIACGWCKGFLMSTWTRVVVCSCGTRLSFLMGVKYIFTYK